MKIALVIPTNLYTGTYPSFLAMSDFPVGFAYIAAALKKAGHEVIGLNPNNCPGYSSARSMLYEKLAEMLKNQEPRLIGLGGLCTDYAFIKDAIAIIRTLAPDIPIVCGGGIITHDAEFTFNLLKPDYCIIGEAEESLVRLVEHLTTENSLLENIPNVGHWRNGIARFTAPSFDYPPVETRAFPDYSPFDPERMIANSAVAARSLYRYTRPYPRIMPFVAARGCPFKCTFCIHHKGPKYRTRSISDILEEISQLYETYRFNILVILDELFAIDKKRLQEFCDGILEGRRNSGWDFDWLFQTHANANLGRHELEMAKEAGCYFFSYGMESASPRVLTSMNKKSRPEQISEAISLATDVGIGFGGNFIFGDIAETPDTITETMDFFLKHCMDMHVYVSQICPYPGSNLFDFCLQQGIIGDKQTFYETESSILYNMTSIPDKVWAEWFSSIIWPLDTFPHVMTAEPYEVTLDRSPRTDNSETAFWLVSARCPHCSVTRSFREPLSEEAVVSGKAAFLTGCSSCGKRFKIDVKGEGRFPGESARRSISAEELKLVIQNSILTLVAPKESFKVLYITLEFSNWQQARSWSYISNLGFEEGFTANGVTFLTVPALQEFAPGAPESWLSHLKAICDGKRFEQVWIEVVHNNLDETILSYIATLAPVRLAIIGESLRYPDEVYVHAPVLRSRQTKVLSRLKYMTHALAGDERDAEWLNRHGTVKAFWWVQSVPEKSVCTPLSRAINGTALFSGALYGEREQWLDLALLKGLLARKQPLEEEARLPELFDQANTEVIRTLRSMRYFSRELLNQHMELLRKIRRESFALWLKGLADGSAVVNLPSFYQGYAGRVYEGMAAGRPVLSWEIPDRPQTNALFENGKEILLFSKDNPEQLAEHILRIQREPEFADHISTNARDKILTYHTLEKRVAQILNWLETGEEPTYGNNVSEQKADRNHHNVIGSTMTSSIEITTITPGIIQKRGEDAINHGNIHEAISVYNKGVRLFPDNVELWRQLRRLSQLTDNIDTANRASGKIVRISSAKNVTKEKAATKAEDFFTQKVAVKIVPDRMHVIIPLCTGKKVLHVGCTDNPIFDPATSLHIQLSKVCRELDGLDVDTEGLEKLQQHVAGRYFTDTRQVTEEYDVLLVPETIEHVDNVREFMESLSKIRFKQCLITAPNAFLPNDNGNHLEESGEYVEYVHPDHNSWFSPYTLKNCISKFTDWKLVESYLLNNKSMAGCLCERPKSWQLSNIPKKVHFYWGNETTSFLRYLSVYSFCKLNPDWEVNIYIPSESYKGEVPWGTGEGYDGTQFSGRNYSDELFRLAGITIKEVDFSAFPQINAAPENYKSDFFRWHILSTEGGLYSDIDLLYFRPMNDLYFNRCDNRDIDCAVCLQYAGNIIGFLFSAPDNEFFRRVFDASVAAFNTASYQSISAPLVNRLFPSEESIRELLPAMKFINMPMDVVYALDHTSIPDIFETSDMERLTGNTIGIHWYAGHPVSQHFNNIVTEDNYKEHESIITNKIGEILGET